MHANADDQHSGAAEDQRPEDSMLEEIRRNAELRLREIEPLIEEAQRLRDVLSVIERGPEGERGAESGHRSANGNGHDHGARVTASRAPKGANKRTILELVAAHPGITPSEIAQSTGVKRTVVASTVSRLKRHGELDADRDGGLRVVGE